MSEDGVGVFSIYMVFSEAAGVAGNLLAFVLFVSPIPTFRRIIRNQSTEQFSGLPYIYALLNCLICLWYGMPIICSGIILIATVNSVGAVFQLVYVAIFIRYADKGRKIKMLGLLLAVFSAFGIIVFLSIQVFQPPNRQLFVGYLSVFSLISMFASPLFVIVSSPGTPIYQVLDCIVCVFFPSGMLLQNLVIRTKSVEYMPFYLSLATFLMSAAFFAYGLLKHDAFVSVPNGIGAILGIVQLVLYSHYSKFSEEAPARALLESYA